ncbi:hypothetical protein [Paenibacillus kobensis]|uniref:hypothetical protein n=1 Tax=Paenibacillus kobensis TaxID=59841 RepID=UPI000FDB4B97|nr:hypothetical protein [Paenibacillus kobensis]
MSKSVEQASEALYSKQQFAASNRFSPQQKDMLSAILTDGEFYTFGAVERLIRDFEKRSVK